MTPTIDKPAAMVAAFAPLHAAAQAILARMHSRESAITDAPELIDTALDLAGEDLIELALDDSLDDATTGGMFRQIWDRRMGEAVRDRRKVACGNPERRERMREFENSLGV